MNDLPICTRTESILAARRAGELTAPELVAHAAACPDCAAALAVEAALPRLSAALSDVSGLPPAAALLREAARRRRKAAAAQLERSLALSRRAGYALVGVASAVAAFLTRDLWLGWMQRLGPGGATALPASTTAVTLVGTLLVAAGAAVWAMQQAAEE